MQRICPVRKRFVTAAFGLTLLTACIGAICASVAQTKPRSSHSTATSSGEFQSLASQADAARDAQQLEGAVALYLKALALNPRWTEGWWSLGTIYYDNDQYASAVNAFQHVVKLDPKQGTALAMLGLSEFELGDKESALRDIEASKRLGILEDQQLRQVVLFHEGLLLQRAGRFEGAQKALASICLSGVKSAELTQTFGMVVLRMRDDKPPTVGTEAAEVVDRLGLGACLGAQKNYDSAREVYASVVSSHPHFPRVHYAFGRFLLDARDRAGAIHEFQEEIKEAPNSVLARLQIGAAEYKVNSTAGLPYVRGAVRLAPKMPFGHYLLGLLLLDLGDYENSIPELEIAQKAFPEEAKLFWSLSVAYSHSARPQDAARARATFARLNQSAGAESAIPGQVPDGASQLEVTDAASASRAH